LRQAADAARAAADAAEAARLAAQASATQALTADAERLVNAFSPFADPGPALALCDRLAAAGEGPRADALRRRLADIYWAEAERQAATDPAAALGTIQSALRAFPQETRFLERQKTLAEALTAARTTAEREAALQALRKVIADKRTELGPGKSTDRILPDLNRLESEFGLASEAAATRQAIVGYYRDAARKAADRETAIAILQDALPVAPDRAALQAEIDAHLAALKAEVASAAATTAQAKTIENKRVQALALAGNPVGKKAAALPGLLAELDRLGATAAAAEVRQAARAAFEAKVAAARAVTDFDPLLEAAARVFPAGSPELAGLQAKKEEFIAGRKTERVAQIRQALENYPPGSPAKALPGLFQELDALGEGQLATDLGGKLRERLTAAARTALPGDPKAAQAIVREALTLPPCKGDATLKALAAEAETAEQAAGEKRRADLVARIDQAIAGPGFPAQPEAVARLITDLEKEPGGAEPAKAARRQAAEALLAAGRAALDGKDLAAARRHADRVKTFVPDHPGQAALAKAIADAAKPPEPPPQPPVTPPATSPVPPQPPDQPPATALEIVVTPGGSPTLAQALAQAKPGMTIKLQPGTHQGGLTIDQAITLTGAGSRDQVILQSSGPPVLTLAGKAMVTNLTVSYTGSSQTDAVKITGGSPTLKNCTVTSSAAAAPPEYSACVGVYGGTPVLQGNTLSGSRGMGLMVKGGKPLVQGNTMDGSAVYGAWFTKGAGGTFTNNTVTRSTRSGVGIKNGAAPVVKGNTVRDNKESGIFIYQDGAGTIQQNTVTGNGSFGIEVGQAGKADRIEGNTVTGNHSHGIYVHDEGSQARVGANTLSGNNGKPEHSEKGGRIDRL
ncbi:MAG: right-handed parallel beta-helix repeat-containing protein, partial [Candidatus Riflebacteria bacterium]|nr:right-handed parallel beta-helix repeat-containing protein [Candidatus Riflebacteria bacterium]